MLVRSSSRVGFTDFGVNAARLNYLAARLREQGWTIAEITSKGYPDYFTTAEDALLLRGVRRFCRVDAAGRLVGVDDEATAAGLGSPSSSSPVDGGRAADAAADGGDDARARWRDIKAHLLPPKEPHVVRNRARALAHLSAPPNDLKV